MLKKIVLLGINLCSAFAVHAQVIAETDPNATLSPKAINRLTSAPASDLFKIIKSNEYTPVKNQGNTGTCWAFSATSLIESKVVKEKKLLPDVSEMYTTRQIYIEKAKNYVLRQGNARFSEGGLGHDLIHIMATYGAMPESVYSGLKGTQNQHNHSALIQLLKSYLDSVITEKSKGEEKNSNSISKAWLLGYTKILDTYLGIPPQRFKYNNTVYTPKSFATDFLQFNENDYINLTSFTHHPYYQPFVLEVPDNFSNGGYYNLPLQELIDAVKNALKNGYTVLWDADVSNDGFNQNTGLAIYCEKLTSTKGKFNPDIQEKKWETDIRQGLFEDLITQDDHLMQITGIEETPGGKTFFIVKNSWGDVGPFHGFIHVSESYFAINTISLVVQKAGLPQSIKDKLNVR